MDVDAQSARDEALRAAKDSGAGAVLVVALPDRDEAAAVARHPRRVLVEDRVGVHLELVADASPEGIEALAEDAREIAVLAHAAPGDEEAPAVVHADIWIALDAGRVGVDLELRPDLRAFAVEPLAEDPRAVSVAPAAHSLPDDQEVSGLMRGDRRSEVVPGRGVRLDRERRSEPGAGRVVALAEDSQDGVVFGTASEGLRDFTDVPNDDEVAAALHRYVMGIREIEDDAVGIGCACRCADDKLRADLCTGGIEAPADHAGAAEHHDDEVARRVARDAQVSAGKGQRRSDRCARRVEALSSTVPNDDESAGPVHGDGARHRARERELGPGALAQAVESLPVHPFASDRVALPHRHECVASRAHGGRELIRRRVRVRLELVAKREPLASKARAHPGHGGEQQEALDSSHEDSDLRFRAFRSMRPSGSVERELEGVGEEFCHLVATDGVRSGSRSSRSSRR